MEVVEVHIACLFEFATTNFVFMAVSAPLSYTAVPTHKCHVEPMIASVIL